MAANQQGDTDITELLGPFILVGIVIGMFVAMWTMYHTVILEGLFLAVHWLAKAMQYVDFLYPDRIGNHLGNWAETLNQADPGRYGFWDAVLMMDTIAHTLLFVLLPWVIWRVWEIRKAYRINRFVRKFDLKRLAQANIAHNPGLRPVLQENLLKQPINEGPWAVNRPPVDWALMHRLVYAQSAGTIVNKLHGLLGNKGNAEAKSKRKYITGWSEKKMAWSAQERRRVMPSPWQCRLDIERTDQVLTEQLGGHWGGFDRLDRFERCVAALLLLVIAKDATKARELALQLGNSFRRLDRRKRHRPTLDDRGVDKIIAKHADHPTVRRVLERHAFKNTAFVGLLNEATNKGVFIANEFLWLKPVNRTLFFSLLQYGGDRPFTEATGVWAHYQEEVREGYGIKVACVEAGTDSIWQMLYEEEWIAGDNGELKSEYEERLSIEDAQRVQQESAN